MVGSPGPAGQPPVDGETVTSVEILQDRTAALGEPGVPAHLPAGRERPRMARVGGAGEAAAGACGGQPRGPAVSIPGQHSLSTNTQPNNQQAVFREQVIYFIASFLNTPARLPRSCLVWEVTREEASCTRGTLLRPPLPGRQPAPLWTGVGATALAPSARWNEAPTLSLEEKADCRSLCLWKHRVDTDPFQGRRRGRLQGPPPVSR